MSYKKNRRCSLIVMVLMIFGLSVSSASADSKVTHASDLTSINDLYLADIEESAKDAQEIRKIKEEIARLKAAEEEAKKKAEEEARILEQQRQAAQKSYTASYTSNGSGLTRSGGVNYHNGWKETWYSSNTLYHYRTGEWTVGDDGVYRDSDGYVIVASSSDAQGSVVDTSFGPGKVYDTGCAEGTHDIYTNW